MATDKTKRITEAMKIQDDSTRKSQMSKQVYNTLIYHLLATYNNRNRNGERNETKRNAYQRVQTFGLS